ncbi:TetR/AcrR family transcriptional regulator [Pseudoalteromonas xiamenensis]|uniref:TetR/AcrR family transcriptional regulator n=1 Tax=Pseudoalteromonas xiamenensis TaxID=882626 RepID=UPI0027E41F8B|nr:TetR/AcrR family transcriptional regulator [Pseudoalteromonas xiamenensis]WMN60875.1 TetR/AcrR family transcriptional regulator [Pseudoalteromonas xiamenensis]
MRLNSGQGKMSREQNIVAVKKFNTEEVLDKAIHTFWQFGYHGTGMQQLLKETNLRAGSLYREFENKDALYLLALRQYAQRSIDNIDTIIKDSTNVLSGIQAIISALIEDSKNTDYCGCFLIKSQLELDSHNSDISAFISGEFAKIETNYARHLADVFSKELSLQYAKQLMMIIYGIRVSGYQKQNTEYVEKTVYQLLPWLGSTHDDNDNE